jgi:hypothetical protein
MDFIKEISIHNAPGYHEYYKYQENFKSLLARHGFSVNQKYIDFINTIGFGSFFDGALVFFPIEGQRGSIITETNIIREINIFDYVVIGYNGTTEGYYCLKLDPSDNAIYWIDIQMKLVNLLCIRFDEWINKQPIELFDKKIYSAFKSIRDIKSIHEVIKERGFVDVELLDYDKKLTRPPGNMKDLLPRYNKLTIAIRKNKPTCLLNDLTIEFLRSGSSIGKDNISYITLDITSLPEAKSQVFEAYLFDAFNVSFDSIECHYKPKIELGNKMRINYKEILGFL